MEKQRQLKQLGILMSLICIFSINTRAYGSGFAIYTQGASPLGQAAATIAHNDDPSAVFYNPALINKLNGTQIQLGTTLLIPTREFESTSGQTFKAESDIFYPSTLFITHKLNDKLSAGFGVFSPFGLATDWGDTWEGRYIATNSELRTFNFNPVISYRVTPQVTVAAGVEYLILDATLEKNISQTVLSTFVGPLTLLPDAKEKFKGDGDGFGYNLGMLVDLTEDISFGASYRSKIRVAIDGKATHDGTDPSIAGLLPDTKGDTSLTLPEQFHAGICYKGLDPLTLEVGMRWEGWSAFKRLKINLDQAVIFQNTSITPRDWKDTYAFNIGAKYQLNDTVALSAGYLYSGNPIPDETFEPSIPDADIHLFSLGASLKHKSWKLDLAYAFQKFLERKKDNVIGDPLTGTSAGGKYNTHLHMVAASLTYAF
ncbi:MAG: outer membrane protein transport protein [Nitrospirota bacterium]